MRERSGSPSRLIAQLINVNFIKVFWVNYSTYFEIVFRPCALSAVKHATAMEWD